MKKKPPIEGLLTETAEGHRKPTGDELRTASSALGLSGEEMARRLGISPRLWRYWVSGDPQGREIPWVAWRVIRLWLNETKGNT